VEVRRISQGVRPKGQMKGSRPSVPCMEQLLSCALTEVVNVLFGYSILKMSIDAAEGSPLIRTFACILEVIVSKLTIVAMVVKNSHTMLFGKVLKGLLGVDCLLRSEMSHQMNVLQT
jgi:hypothetical protein